MQTMIHKLRHALATRGLLETIVLVKKNLLYETRWYLDRAFDRRFGTDTSGIIELDSLEIKSDNIKYGVYYEPTSTGLFKYIMKMTLTRIENIRDFVFIDFGSGKGRTILQASNYFFRRIIGVEFSPLLHQIARKNIAAYKNRKQKCFDIESVCMDVCDYQVPSEDIVCYFYDPFQENVMAKVLENIRKSSTNKSRKVVIIYFNPLVSRVIESNGYVREIEIRLPHDITREHQRKCYIYSAA
jgi:SAM-dependent methyltransferase